MDVSRETSPPWVSLCDYISRSLFYKHIFKTNNHPSVLKNNPPGATELLFSTNIVQRELGFALIVKGKPRAEKMYLGLSDLFPGHIFYAPSKNTESGRPSLFISEDEKNFESAFAATVFKKPAVIIADTDALNRQVHIPKQKHGRLFFNKNSSSSLGVVVKTLTDWGYEPVDITTTPRSFAVRGGILDIFPLYSTLPVRIEFYGDNVETLREFNPVSQLSISSIENLEIVAPSGYKSENKILFRDALKGAFSQFYYLKEGSVGLTISNTSSFNGALLKNDCVSYSGSVLINNPGLKTFVFGSGFSNQQSTKEKLGKYFIINKPLCRGFISKSMGLSVVGYKDLNMFKPVSSSGPTFSQKPQEDIRKFEWGDYVVHEDYGVGVYRGLSFVGKAAARRDSVVIEFSGGDSVHVSVDRFDKIHRYVSPKSGIVILSRLGTKTWQGRLARAKKSVDSIVEELVDLYSFRQKPRGYSYVSDNELVDILANSFPFEETPDQKQAIKDVLSDLDRPSPMDRVILGDVGFGKTEVALRASMKAVASGRQVFFMVPTTVLADQHYITAKNRLGGLGVNVDLLSRFQKKSEQLVVLDKIKNKKTDIVIGTHRLMSNDVPTENLGVLIIDEEHRFGVKHKERIRLLKKDVDVLTLTATPIPRTLQQSLIGVRDISRIDTPPKERLPIKTTILYYAWGAIKHQIQREVDRGGQVYFLHNDIRSIPFVVKKIKKLFPDSVVKGAHGSMTSKNLEKTILSFFSGQVDVLVCTTIIESGLDVTNANTVIINNAHRLGLAQLYQIRGRVGRGKIQAYCWLLIPDKKLNENAFRRLKAIEHYSALGSGYQIALKDLEIRGSGSLFGYEQSGHINNVGYNMYCKILKKGLDEVVGSTKNGKGFSFRPVVSFKGPAYFPSTYIFLAQDRIYYYQRLATAVGVKDVLTVRGEIIDRFGRAPSDTENLFSIAKTREHFSGCGVKKVSVNKNSVGIVFADVQRGFGFNFDGMQEHMSSLERVFRFNNDDGFMLLVETESLNDSLFFASGFAEWIRTDVSA